MKCIIKTNYINTSVFLASIFLIITLLFSGIALADPFSGILTDDIELMTEYYWPDYQPGFYSNYATDDDMEAYSYTGSNNFRYNYSFIKFDLSSIPDDYTISSVTLGLYALRSRYEPIIYRVTNDNWVDDGLDQLQWETPPYWNNKYPPNMPRDGLLFNGHEDGWDITDAWVYFDLNWEDYTTDLADNYFTIALTARGGGGAFSSKFATKDHWDPTLAPMLTIEAEPATVIPEPATMLLLGSGLIGLAGFRRKKSKN